MNKEIQIQAYQTAVKWKLFIKSARMLKKVVRRFDGKLMNKRFVDAVNAIPTTEAIETEENEYNTYPGGKYGYFIISIRFGHLIKHFENKGKCMISRALETLFQYNSKDRYDFVREGRIFAAAWIQEIDENIEKARSKIEEIYRQLKTVEKDLESYEMKVKEIRDLKSKINTLKEECKELFNQNEDFSYFFINGKYDVFY